MLAFPLQLVDEILQNYHIGHALLIAFVVVVLGGFFMNRSNRLLGLLFIVFGLIFILTPSTEIPPILLFFGVALVIVGPVIMVAAND